MSKRRNPGQQSNRSVKPFRRKKRFRLELGLRDEHLRTLGYRTSLTAYHKTLFVLSIIFAMIPFWFIHQSKTYSRSAVRATLAFVVNLALWIVFAWLFVMWIRS